MVLYIYPIETAFTRRDIEMLTPYIKVKPLRFTNNPFALPFYFVIQLFQLIWFLPKTSHYLCFFGGYHTVLPTVFGRFFNIPTYIQSGGMDAMNLPAIGYGNFRKKWLRKATVFSFRHCSLILPVAESLVKSDYNYDKHHPKKQGLLNLIPGLNTPIQVVANGFDDSFWTDEVRDKEPFSFVTVATGISKESRMLIKGLDLIIRLAEIFPGYSFHIIGDENFSPVASNVKIHGKLSRPELKKILQKMQFYLQLSTSEGFPNALAEAMLCGCIPIGSAVGAIPEIIGDSGFVLREKNIEDLKEIFLGLPNQDLKTFRKKARNRIVTQYHYRKRQRALLRLFQIEIQ
jgi:glycosyltransferase involved in cell wall biosynthesis